MTQGLSDKNGVFQTIASQNEEFINILINKDGFYSVKRTYVREIESSNVLNSANKQIQTFEKPTKNETDSITRDIYVYLVREVFVLENSLMLLFTYSNAFENNFVPITLETSIPDPGTF